MSNDNGIKNLFLQSPLYYFLPPEEKYTGSAGCGYDCKSFESLMDLLPGKIDLVKKSLSDLFKNFMAGDILFRFEIDTAVKKFRAEPKDFLNSGCFCGTSLLREMEYEIGSPDLIKERGTIFQLPKGKYRTVQGSGLDGSTIRKAAHTLWLESIWEDQKLCDRVYFLRVLREGDVALFQIIWPVK